MQIAVSIRWAVVIDNDVHTFDIDTTAEDIRGNKYTFLERFECGVPGDTTQND